MDEHALGDLPLSVKDWGIYLMRSMLIPRPVLQELFAQVHLPHPRAVECYYVMEIILPSFALCLVLSFPLLSGFLCVLGYFSPRIYLFIRLMLQRQMLKQELLNVLTLLLICVEMSDHFLEIFKDLANGLKQTRPALGNEMQQLCHRLEHHHDPGFVWQNFAKKFDAKDFGLIVDMLYMNQIHGSDSSGDLKEQLHQFRVQRMSSLKAQGDRAEIMFKALNVLCFLPVIMIILIGPVLININKDLAPLGSKNVRAVQL